ncbi:MAG: hypothetical protein JWN84_2326 [Nocardioides sp.]|nr:hypothetical protein [Nocardioides sp.]
MSSWSEEGDRAAFYYSRASTPGVGAGRLCDPPDVRRVVISTGRVVLVSLGAGPTGSGPWRNRGQAHRVYCPVMRRRRTSSCLLGLAAAVLVGCGDQTTTATTGTADTTASTSESPEAAAPVVMVGDEPMVSCGGPEGWAPSVMAEGIESDFDEAEARQAFTDLLADPEMAGELELSFLADGPGTEFRVLQEEDDEVTLGLRSWSVDGPGPRALAMTVVREGETWTFAGGGTCRLSPILRSDAQWIDVTGATAAPDGGRSLTIDVNERQCTSARDPGPFLLDPVVVETDESVTVYGTSTPMTGTATRPGNPTAQQQIVLDEPLGDRTVHDGATWPPREVPVR